MYLDGNYGSNQVKLQWSIVDTISRSDCCRYCHVVNVYIVEIDYVAYVMILRT
ncbi:predicted protein [Botrytis cinerea T4]|uniref:Uncharacterized protein n=1 Tax=Botryotinia fuckeliana (strain T4) TaxID=999810 RepID=G2Y6A5_BOTF4|nr:predicted protein [Botrytis cinerea T4]